ncbi:TRAP transporter TatT component family protein [candidate division KSB1 bacterium]
MIASILILQALGNVNCSVQKLAVGATGGIIDNTLESIFEESDLQLAEAAIMPNLKMLEGLIKSDPGNEKLLLEVVRGYTGYALGWVEDEDPARARLLYERAKDYGIQLLSENRKMKDALEGPISDFESSLRSVTGESDVPVLFWTANAWASFINLSRGDILAFIEMPRVQAMMSRVIELDETFYYGSAHLFFGLIYSTLGVAGGDFQKATEHFNRAREISDDKFLLTKVYYARYYAVGVLNEELFRKTLEEVLASPADQLPEVRLINEIAKKKARFYLTQAKEWFSPLPEGYN